MRLIASLLLLVMCVSSARGQSRDPKREFTDALGRVSGALEGRFGDDPSRVADGLAALDQALTAWDDSLARYEASMSGELVRSSPQGATRLHVALALTLAERGRVDDALKQLDRAIALSPQDVDAHTVLGLVHSQLTANAPAAISAFRMALAADPSAPLQRYLLVEQLADQGAVEEAATIGLPLRTDHRSPDAPDRTPFLRIHLVPEVPGIEPYFPYVRYAEAFALLARGRYEAGVAGLRAAAATDSLLAPPETVRADLSQAGVALRDGDTDAALAALDRVRQAAPAWSEGHRLRGLVLVADERFNEGIAELQEALRLTPDDERSHLTLADVLIEQARYVEADVALRTAIANVRPSARLHYTRGRVLQRQGLYADALIEFDRARSLQPLLPLLGKNSVYETIATLHRSRQEFAEATRAFAVRASLIPNDVNAHRDLGDIYFRQGLDDVAWNEFAMAEALAPRDVATQAALAQLHLRAGRNAEAATATRRILGLEPEHAQAHFVLGTALMRMDQAAEGTRELDTFARLQAAEADARARELELAGLRREAEISTGLGDHARAVELLSRIVEKIPKSAGAHEALGVALLKAGRTAAAVDELQAAAGLGAFGVVYRHLADAYAALGQNAQSTQAREVYLRIRRDRLREAARQ
jgi:tetratricopeptide (TPR) repeat protein